MKKFKVEIPLEYVQGHLRYGHLEAEIEAKTEEEAKTLAKEWAEDGDMSIEVDDYSIDDIGDVDYENMIIEEINE